MQPFPPLAPSDYDRAVEFWPSELMRRVKNIAVVPTWLEGEDRFWVRLERAQGHDFMLVDAATGEMRPAFDHGVVAAALGADPDELPLRHFEYLRHGSALLVQVDGRNEWYDIDLSTGELTPVPARVGANLVGPDGRQLFVRDHNIFIRELDGSERALTTDGEEYFAWASPLDHDYRGVDRRRGVAVPVAPTGTSWSPDGRVILTQQSDERHVPGYPYLESTPSDASVRPRVHRVKMKLAGEADRYERSWYLIDTITGERTPVARLDGDLEIDIERGQWWWDPTGSSVYVLVGNVPSEDGGLARIDTATGAVHLVVHEHVDTFFGFNTFSSHIGNVRVLPERGQAIWYSERSGWGHLYLVDLATGSVLRPLTEGEWAVFDIMRVTASTVFFSAGGADDGRNPYFRRLFRVDLDADAPNAGLRELTPEDADHGFEGAPSHAGAVDPSGYRSPLRQPVAPSGRYFVDNISRVDMPTRTVLRDEHGREIATIAEADASELLATGWRFPEIFSSTAADGSTPVWGVILTPRDFAQRSSWPVVERIYGGAWISAQPRSFAEGLNGPFMYGLHAMAEMGMAVVVMDGPGTPYRSKRFHDLTWDQADRWGIAHHRAALEGAAATRPWMDLSMVGISGHSYGGYGTAMALMLEPDFYRVGFSSSGMYDPMLSHGVPEIQLGRPLFDAGRTVKLAPGERAANYEKFAPQHYVDRLTGHLMLAYGDLDENIQPAALLSFIDALTAAGKHYDLVYLPGRNHHHTTEPYHQKRLWDFFIERIQRRDPVWHYPLPVQQGQRLYRFG